jgi:pyruvate kinase
MHPDVVLEAGATVRLRSERIVGDAGGFTLWPETVFAALGPEANLTVDFDGAVLRVVSVGGGDAVAEVVTPGKVRSNKAVVVDPPPELPALSQKDLGAIAFGASNGITHYALSFASAAEDVEHLRSLATPGAHIIAKIESRAGVRNMDGIIEATDSVLIDRGDLSREIPLEHVPYYQKAIARRANRWNRPVYVATNLLESMVTATVPTIAEANDIANTLLDGVHGLVLAAETAIGVDPIASVDIVRRAVRAFERSSDRQLLDDDHLTLVNPSAG